MLHIPTILDVCSKHNNSLQRSYAWQPFDLVILGVRMARVMDGRSLPDTMLNLKSEKAKDPALFQYVGPIGENNVTIICIAMLVC